MDVVAIEEDLIGGAIGLFGAAGGVDDNGVPVGKSIAVLVEEEAGFAKKPFVEAIVFLELGFAEADDAGLFALGRQENAIDFTAWEGYPRINPLGFLIDSWVRRSHVS